MDKILIVDDEPDNVELLVQILEDEGYDILSALSAKEALDIVSKEIVDLILLDVTMPGMDGFELCEILKSDEKTSEIPVIFVTALGETTDKVKGLDIGAVDYITKPIEPAEVVARVRTHLRIKSVEKALQEKNKQLSETMDKLANANLQLKSLSLTDALMNILNRRGFDIKLDEVHKGSVRYNRCYSVMIIDINYFKLYNDTYGHPAGDDALRKVASILKNESRDTDFICRYGGDEIAIISLETTRQTALIHAERLRNSVWQANIPHSSSPVSDRLTISIGVASFEPGCGYSPAQIVKQADIALYQAKKSGRNAVVVYEQRQ